MNQCNCLRFALKGKPLSYCFQHHPPFNKSPFLQCTSGFIIEPLKIMTNLDSILKSRDITLPTKVHIVKAMVFPVVLYGYENWTIRKAEYWIIDAFGMCCWRRLEISSDSKWIQPVYPKVNQSWIFIGRTHAETPILWSPDAKTSLSRKDPDAGKNWRPEEKGLTEYQTVGWHYWLDTLSLSKLQ